MRNKVQLIGNLGSMPEVKATNANVKVARVAIATNETYKNAKGGYVKETTWHSLVIRGKQEENAERLLKKGSEVAVEGKIINRSYEGKDGQKRYVSEIRVDAFILLGHPAEKN